MVECENLKLHSAFFANATVCIESNSTKACSLCLQSLCSNCLRENHHVCNQGTNDDEVHILTDATAMVTWIIHRLHASNKYIGTIKTRKTAYNLRDLLRCNRNPAYTDAACLYWGRLGKSGQIFGNVIASINVGREKSNSLLQLVLSSDSIFDPLYLIPALNNIVKSKRELEQVIDLVISLKYEAKRYLYCDFFN